MKNISWKPIFVLGVIAVAIICIIPSIDMAIKGKKDPTLWPKKKINLGLDLQGGMHLVLEVGTQKAVESQIDRIARDLRNQMREKHIRHTGINKVESTKISVALKGRENIKKFESLLDKDYRNLRSIPTTGEEITTFFLDFPDKEAAYMKKMATEQALETIRNRIDEFGVSEPNIRIQGEKRILIQLPGISDTQRAKDLIGKTALLEFRLVDETHDINTALSGNVPAGSEILYQVTTDPDTHRDRRVPYLIKKDTPLTGADLTDAKVNIDSQYNEPYVSLTFNRKGGRIFSRITEENVNKRLAIVLDNKVYSAPNINEKISGGRAQITGRFSMDEAHDLAIVLRAGALPAPVKIIEERTVGPSLGKDSINKGLFSMCVGGILVIVFMMLYYKGAGLIADLALVINIILIAGALAVFQATLTLPGIAGMILTIGMAVDANVLIFERIKEEMTLGKTPRAAVAAGFERATLTILDANVTTIIVAFVLFQFGTGPVKGFAITLIVGIIASLFTALILSRLIFDFLLINRNVKALSI